MVLPALILLVACANLANQLLARAVQRGREIAVRLSLGGSRARIIRLLLIESLLLAVVASLVALVLARVLVDVIGTQILVIPFRIPIDLRVALFTAAVALGTALAFGLIPALRATRLDLAQAVKEGGSGGGYRRSRLRNTLIVVQVAASVALLALSGVFAGASQRNRVQESVENATRLLTIPLNLDLVGYDSTRGGAFQARARERLRAVPGVTAVALAPFDPAGSIPHLPVLRTGDPPEQRDWYDTGLVAGDWLPPVTRSRLPAGSSARATERAWPSWTKRPPPGCGPARRRSARPCGSAIRPPPG